MFGGAPAELGDRRASHGLGTAAVHGRTDLGQGGRGDVRIGSVTSGEAEFPQPLIWCGRAESELINGPMTSRLCLVTDNGSSFIAQRFRKVTANQYAHAH